MMLISFSLANGRHQGRRIWGRFAHETVSRTSLKTLGEHATRKADCARYALFLWTIGRREAALRNVKETCIWTPNAKLSDCFKCCRVPVFPLKVRCDSLVSMISHSCATTRKERRRRSLSLTAFWALTQIQASCWHLYHHRTLLIANEIHIELQQCSHSQSTGLPPFA